MAEVRLAARQACTLYGCPPAELRRRVNRKEVRGGRDESVRDVYVLVDVDRDELPAGAAGKLLGIATPSVRAAIRAGRLEGRKAGTGWVVPVAALLGDRRFPAELRRLLEPDGFAALDAQEPTAEPAPDAGLRRSVFARVTAQEWQALTRLRDRHGSIARAVGAAVLSADRRRALEDDREQLRTAVADRDERLARKDEELGRARSTAALYPAELRCPDCGEWVPLAALEESHDDPEHGTTYLHKHGGMRGVFQPATPLARRR